MKRKITVTTGTRAEYGFFRPILKKIVKNSKFQLYLIVTGTHLSKKHGYSISEIKNDGFKVYVQFDMLPKGNTNYHMSIALAKGVIHFSKIFQKIKPDINLILGDRDEMLGSALAAYHMNIPNAHIHGGDKSQGGIDEYTRHAITKISNIHFASTQKSFQRIIKMGENPKNVFHSGSPGIDEIVSNKITSKKDLEKKFKIKFSGNEILLVYHPVTTQAESSGIQINNILKAINNLKKPIIALGPNSDAGSKEILANIIKFSKKNQNFHFYRNLLRSDYLGLLNNIGVLVGNSSSGIIEASYFAVPVVNIGIRQKGREKGKNVIDVSDEKSLSIQNAVIEALKRKKKGNLSKIRIYGNGNASKKIVSILEKIKLDKKLIQKQINY